MRQRYKNLSGTSGVREYEIAHGFIRIWFLSSEGYEYDETRPGAEHVEQMQHLAEAGGGSRHLHQSTCQRELRTQIVNLVIGGAHSAS